MGKKSAIICVFLILSGIVFSQDKELETADRDATSRDSPLIIVTAECEGKQGIRFRLSNSTKWAIAVSTFSCYLNPKNGKRTTLLNGMPVYLLPDDREISSIFYYTEKEKSEEQEKSLVLGGYKTDSYNTSWIGSENSIIFSIPKDEFKDGVRAYILFKYEWELNEKGTFSPSGIQHRSYFLFPDHNNLRKLPDCSGP